ASARAAYELALDNFRRQEPLFRDSIISALEFENVRAQRDQAEAQLRLAEAAVEQARKQLAHTEIRAPFAGTVEAHFVDVGEQIAMGQPVVRLVNLREVKVRAGVPERYARDIRVGTSVELRFQAYGLPPREATVTFVGNAIDPGNRTFPVEVRLDNPDGQLKPEMVVRVRLAREVLDSVVVVPLPAVVRDETGTSVFVADSSAEGPVARQRYVTLGPSSEGWWSSPGAFASAKGGRARPERPERRRPARRAADLHRGRPGRRRHHRQRPYPSDPVTRSVRSHENHRSCHTPAHHGPRTDRTAGRRRAGQLPDHSQRVLSLHRNPQHRHHDGVPRASPEDIESLITKPIEEELQGIAGIDEIRSTSTEGVSTIVVEFMPDQISLDEAFQKVRDKVDIAKAELPEDAEEPIVSEIDLSELPIMTINLAAPYALSRLKEVAEDLSDELEALPDVLEATVVGGLEREVQVNVDRAALQAYNLTFNDVINAIQRENTNLPGGSIDVDRLNYLVRVDGEFEVPEEINNIVIKAPGGKPIYVRDVAEVVFGYKERDSYAYLRVLQREEDGRLVPVHNQSGEPLQVVSLSIRKRSGANILETTEAIRQVLDRFPFPAAPRWSSRATRARMCVRSSATWRTTSSAADLRGGGAAVLPGRAHGHACGHCHSAVDVHLVPGLPALGYTLNFVILFSLIIALGMLVDNAIVIVENIYRFREQGYSRFEAARLATAEVGAAVVASTATTVAAFVPMLFWPGIIGEFMSFLPLTLIITLTSSLFVALVINPVLTGYFMRVEGEKAPRPPRRVRVLAAAVILVLGLVLGLANWKTLVVLAVAVPVIYLLHRYIFSPIGNWFIHHGLPGLIRRYRAFLSWMLERDYSVRHALLRNTLALGSFTLGVVLLVLGGGLSALLGGGPAGMVLTIPGTILAVVGLIGIILHTLETLFLGGWATVRGGLIFGAVVLVITGLMYLSPREVALTTIVELLTLPLLIIVVGLLGALLNRRGRRYLILTDNRARLLNSVLGALFAILAMFAIAPTGVEFFPKTDPNQIQVTLTAPLGTNVETTDRIAREALARIEQLLNEHPEDRANVKNIQVNVGVGGDRMFGGGSSKPEVATITLDLVDYEDRAVSSRETLDRLRRQLQGIPGVTIKIDQDNPGPPTGPPVNIEISGPEFTEIVRITQEIKQRLIEAAETGRIPGLVDITDNLNTGRPELRVRIDRERAGRFGLSTQQIASTVRAAINGIEASQYRTGEDEYDITVRLKEADRRSLESLRNLTILHEGQQIPLAAVADFELGGGLGA
ncbi:efflux RND transporter permease subunit, partial [Rhodothermus marinus]|uniref:efflux RND transporter permease subunit n=1 Tax=Rhodothermus marinus TaxID=29549 RepID=UPI002434114E